MSCSPSAMILSCEGGSGPVACTVFKTGGRGDEPRRWVRLPCALASGRTGVRVGYEWGTSGVRVGYDRSAGVRPADTQNPRRRHGQRGQSATIVSPGQLPLTWPCPGTVPPVAGTSSLGLVTCIRPTTTTLARPAPVVNCPDAAATRCLCSVSLCSTEMSAFGNEKPHHDGQMLCLDTPRWLTALWLTFPCSV